MLLRGSTKKTKNLFQKTLLKLKSLFFGGYQKLPKPLPLLNPFSCTNGKKTKKHQTNRFYTDFCSNEWECNLEEAKKKSSMIIASEDANQKIRGEDASSGRFLKMAKKSSALRNKPEEVKKEEKNAAEGYALAQKMKQLDMMDDGANDVEHVLDIEEALHYYARLRSPVYLDIVDRFFMDMYSEFSVPQPSASICNSNRRLGSIRL